LPCPTLIAPVNGYMQCSDYPVVVNSTCSFTCKDEYDLFGSSVRLCGTDTTWNGTNTDCQIKQCSEIQTLPNSVQLQSCQTSVNSTCFFSCVPGYFIDSATDATYNQECIVTEGVALWTPPEICKETTACNPSPCLTGTCYVSDSNEPYCVCPDEYVGKYCGTLSVTISDLPLLNNNERSPPISIYASPQSSVTVSITTEPPVAIIPSDQITIYHPDNVSSFYLESSQSSFIRLKLRVSDEGEEEATTIDDRVTVASDEKATGKYFKGEDVNNILTEGCCRPHTDLISRYCTGRSKQLISFTSTCAWTGQNNEYTSNGIIFVSVGRQSLPVSIIGINMQLSDEGLTTDFTRPGLSCSPCADCRSTSVSPQRMEDVRDMVKRLSMINTFLSAVGPILPQHLTIEADGEFNKNYYSTGDYLAKIVPEYQLSSLLECPNIPIDTTNTDLYYVITTSSGLQFAYNNDKQLYASSSETVCFAYPLCSGDRTLYVPIPPQLDEQIQNLAVFNRLRQNNWEFNIKSIETSRYGLSTDQPVTYWDGNIFTSTTQPNYKLKAEMSITGRFQEQYLEVRSIFHGSVTEATDTENSCQVVQTVKGEMDVEIRSGLIASHEHSVLHLTAGNGQGLYVTKGKSCSDDPIMPGLEIDLYLSPLLTNGTYSKYIQIKSTEPCLVKSHFQFNNFDHINSVSILSSCLVFRIDELEFSNLPLKLTLSPQNIGIIPNRVSTVTIQSRIESEVTIGNFITMLPNSDSKYPDLQAILFSDDNDVFCMLPSVNISLFDTQITTPVQINEDGVQFRSPLNLFYIGETNVLGRGSADRPWGSLQLHLKVIFTADSSSDLSNYINTELRGEIENAVQHIESAYNAFKSSSHKVADLTKHRNTLEKEWTEIQTNLDSIEKELRRAEKDRDDHEALLYHEIEAYWNATEELSESIESACRIQECKRTCKSGIVFTTCFVPVTVVVEKSCGYYAREKATIHEEIGTKTKICSYGRPKKDLTGAIVGGILSLVTTSPIFAVVGIVGSIFSKRKMPCMPIEVIDYTWSPKTHFSAVVRYRKCDVLSVKEHKNINCNYTSPCAVYEVDPVCDAKNEECYGNRTKIIENFSMEDEELIANIKMRHFHYKQALNQLIKLSSEFAVLTLQNSSKSEEIEATDLRIQIAQESEKVANRSYLSIKASHDRIISFRDALQNNFNSIIRITDVSFDVTLETQTPVIVPLNVIYEITSRRATHEVRIVVDISATDDLVKKTIYDNIYDDIIDNVIGGSLRKRRNVASSFRLFPVQVSVMIFKMATANV
uniref:EGF-like domain-containing protein n=1 Tax=Amphimedon queenslandica TaxID=400682 RepID=A0A1X7TT31_AMPQE